MMKIERFGPGEDFVAGNGHPLPNTLGDGTPAAYVLVTPLDECASICFGSKRAGFESGGILIKQPTVFKVNAYTYFACSRSVNIVPVEC